LKRAVGADVVHVETAEPARLRDAVIGQSWAQRVADGGAGEVHVYVEDASVALPAVIQLATAQGIALERVTYSQPTLDDVFLLHTGRELREEGAAA
jgi:ABC-2 type transport system ATP-binding protein